MKKNTLFLLIFIFVFPISTSLYALPQQTNILNVDSYLVLGPINTNLPAFHNESSAEFDYSDLLKFNNVEVVDWWPSDGDAYQWTNQKSIKWHKIILKDNKAELQPEANPQIYYLAFYISTDRWVKAQLSVKSCQLLEVYLDGVKAADKSSVNKIDAGKCEPGELSHELELEQGKHLVLIKTLNDPNSKADWNVESSITYDGEYSGNISVTTAPLRTNTVGDLLNNPKVRSVRISADGNYAAIRISEHNKITDKGESWIELRDLTTGKLVNTYRGGLDVSGLDWAPKGDVFAYTTSSNGGSTIWVVNLDDGTNYPLLQNVENFGGFEWSPDASYMIYMVIEKEKIKDPYFKKFDYPEDRWPGYRNQSYLYKVNLPNGTTQRLTAGKLGTSLNSIKPDGSKLLFSKSEHDFSVRPFSKTIYYTLDLNNLQVDSITTLRWANSAQWAPEGNKILFLGGPSTFGDAGVDLPDSVIPNDYDTQAFIYDIDTKEVDAITKYFDPQISSAYWDKSQNAIYFNTVDQSYKHLYKYDLKTKKYEYINLDSEYLEEINFAKNKPIAVYIASSSNVHPKAFTLKTQNFSHSLLLDTEAKYFKDIKVGDVKDWNFTAKDGNEIKGRIYFPPNFDPAKKYPALVYYYGGTSPITREFEGRYPKNIWAANGYVIYVLQPSGATGFGQKFSALHVNDWGETVAAEIIEGTKKFLASHSFVDPNRVGCLGASYGGFMTLNLVTKTNMFAAAISHAGISDITSYWGVGYWGYLYSAVATAKSYPWNRKDIYVNDSPIYNADKINTPLLLLHGNIDPNVPPGESMQMYVALKILGKDVNMIQIDQQEHWIMQYDKREKWSKTIIAYFDKYLKGQPQWWNALYGN